MKLHPEHGTMERLWYDKPERCSEKHPHGKVECDLRKGHNGDHIDFDEFGNERSKWARKKDDPEVNIVLTDAPRGGESNYAIEGEVVGQDDPHTLLEWARAQNPKVYRSSQQEDRTPPLSIQCTSASKALHDQCKTTWCECPCHDDERKPVDPTKCGECGHFAGIHPYHTPSCSRHPDKLKKRLPWMVHMGLWFTLARIVAQFAA